MISLQFINNFILIFKSVIIINIYKKFESEHLFIFIFWPFFFKNYEKCFFKEITIFYSYLYNGQLNILNVFF